MKVNIKMKNEVNANPLVSIIVITYNSAKYVIETLESAKYQSCKNIELIISDDCSTDDTVTVCETWIKENKDCFIRTKLITVEQNKGIPANCNRGVNTSNGEWIKLIAGDDILLPNCIEDNLRFINLNKNAKIVFSTMQLFRKEDGKTIYLGISPLDNQKKMYELNANEQYNTLIESNWNWATPSSFIQKKVIIDLDFYDTDYTHFEDYPFWIKATKKGVKLHFFDKATVLYRQSQSMMRPENLWINEKYFQCYILFFNRQISNDLKKTNKKAYNLKRRHFFKLYVLIKIFGNKRSIIARLFNRMFHLFFKTIDL